MEHECRVAKIIVIVTVVTFILHMSSQVNNYLYTRNSPGFIKHYKNNVYAIYQSTLKYNIKVTSKYIYNNSNLQVTIYII